MPESTNLFENGLAAILEKDKKTLRYRPMPNPAEVASKIDFGSNDGLSLTASGALRREFLRELERNPGFQVGGKASRLLDGNNKYVVDLEAFVADYHKAEASLFFCTGYDANVAVFTVLPQASDVIVYDEYIQ